MRQALRNSRTPWLLVAALAWITLACPIASEAQPKQAASKSKPRVALIMKSLANEFFKTMEDGARKHQADHAAEYDIIANGIKDELDVNKQVEIVEFMIAQKVDAIVIAPADSKALVPVCKKASDAGIAVVNIDNRFDAAALKDIGMTIPFVGPDNRKGAKAVGEALVKTLKPADKVAILEGAPNAFNGEQRKLGFMDALKGTQIQVATSQTGYWETDKANMLAQNILIAHPDLKAFLCANDSMALGAEKAVEDAGKTGRVAVVGFDNIQAVQDLLKTGKILATADQHADLLAVYGIEVALEILKNKAVPADRETPVDLITAPGSK